MRVIFMQVEPYANKDGFRVWLSKNEQSMLVKYYSEHPTKQLANELMLDGLRSDEVNDVVFEDFREMETEQEGYILRIWESKTNFRECPVSVETYNRAKMLKNVQGIHKDEPLVDYSTRQIQRWVENAGKDIADGSKYWSHLTAHDCRRTWATHTYWSLSGDRAREVVMAWGGWRDVQTFMDSYLGRIPDDIAVNLMDEAELR